MAKLGRLRNENTIRGGAAGFGSLGIVAADGLCAAFAQPETAV
eukprot:COSAG03_NODE_24601_length_271_cov_0.604651_1_plen_42_part_10